MLVGTELSVRSRAQAVRNTEVALKSLALHPGMEDLELILPADLLNGRRSLWPVLALAHKVCGVDVPPRQMPSRNTAAGGSSRKDPKSGRSRSLSPAPPPPPPDAQATERGRASGVRRGSYQRPNRSRSGPSVRRGSVSPAGRVRAKPSPVVRRVSFRSSSSSSPFRRQDATAQSPAPPDVSESRKDPGYIARRSARSASPPKRRRPSRSPSKSRGDQIVREGKENCVNGHAASSSPSPTKVRELEKGWNSSWSQDDRDQLWDRQVCVDRGVLATEKDKLTSRQPKKKLTSYLGQFKKRKSKSAESWQPPAISELDQQASKLETLPPVLPPQQSAVRDWLYSIGLSVRDGEGGFTNWSGSSGVSLPQLKDDRIRNGELLCDLVAMLEPNAATHAQLLQLVNRKPPTIPLALENIERALWLLRIRKCPPIPQVYLCQPMAVIQAHKPLLWGLLQEIMQAYPASSGDGVRGGGVSLRADLCSGKRSTWSSCLPYSIADRKALDQSLMHWLVEEEILSGIMKGLLPSDMPSIATLEGPLRDGTMLCLLAGKVLGRPVMGWHRKAKSFNTCVANLKKCTQALRSHPSMGLRFLYSGVEEDVAKGEWVAILGLLEDMHRLRDGVAPIKEKGENKGHETRRPYVGHIMQEWPPPMHANDIGENRKFTVQVIEGRPSSAVNLVHNVRPDEMQDDGTGRYGQKRPAKGPESSLHTAPSMRWDITATTRRSDIDLFPGHDTRPRSRPNDVDDDNDDAMATDFVFNRERLSVRGGEAAGPTSADIFPKAAGSSSFPFDDNNDDAEENGVRALRVQYEQRHGLAEEEEAPSYREPKWTSDRRTTDIAPGT